MYLTPVPYQSLTISQKQRSISLFFFKYFMKLDKGKLHEAMRKALSPQYFLGRSLVVHHMLAKMGKNSHNQEKYN